MTTSERIIRAALQLTAERGATRLTTKAIAQAADVSEATLFKYFPTKGELLLAVIREAVPTFRAVVSADQAGTGTVQERLEQIARGAIAHYGTLIPLVTLAFSDTELLERQRPFWEGMPGPRSAHLHLSSYLSAEQRLGRIAPDRDPMAMASLLLGACFQWIYLTLLQGEPFLLIDEDQFVRHIVAELVGKAGEALPTE